eukprot:TRINITY_DN13420_c0_g1_i1.p1 TRINITY_DN13420_c0_g1~~TRINITY_DN13420_c0_g1_i1.p1  ORF type:complete len:104 (+),score=14.20 TRINITY_DN13420_c0_g1_i1:96-407(+)
MQPSGCSMTKSDVRGAHVQHRKAGVDVFHAGDTNGAVCPAAWSAALGTRMKNVNASLAMLHMSPPHIGFRHAASRRLHPQDSRQIGRAVQQECRDRSRMPSSA